MSSDTVSNASTATATSARRLLRSSDFFDGMVGRADHSIKHAIVPALTTFLPATSLSPDSILKRELAELPKNKGKYRPWIVVEKPRGNRMPAQIVLTTHFDGQPVQQTDAVAQTLAVALGSATPPWPAANSPRVRLSPEWDEENSYLLAFPIKLMPGRNPTRFRRRGVEYEVEEPELKVLRAVCQNRVDALAAMSTDELEALKVSYETHVSTYRPPPPSRGGSVYPTRSQLSFMPSIPEDTPKTPIPEVNEDDAKDGFEIVKRKVKRRGGSAVSRQSAGR